MKGRGQGVEKQLLPQFDTTENTLGHVVDETTENILPEWQVHQRRHKVEREDFDSSWGH